MQTPESMREILMDEKKLIYTFNICCYEMKDPSILVKSIKGVRILYETTPKKPEPTLTDINNWLDNRPNAVLFISLGGRKRRNQGWPLARVIRTLDDYRRLADERYIVSVFFASAPSLRETVIAEFIRSGRKI